MIDGVKVLELTTYPDDRGFFREISRFKEIGLDVAQASHAKRAGGVANGWHIHRHHSELFYVAHGTLRLVLKDCRIGMPVRVSFPYDNQENIDVDFGDSGTGGEYMEIVLGDYLPRAVLVPNGVAHGYKAIGETCDIIYWTTKTYAETRHDEGRIEFDRWPEHNWARDIEIR